MQRLFDVKVRLNAYIIYVRCDFIPRGELAIYSG